MGCSEWTQWQFTPHSCKVSNAQYSWKFDRSLLTPTAPHTGAPVKMNVLTRCDLKNLFFTNVMGLTNFCSTERVFYLFTLFKISQLKSVSFFLRVLSKGEKRRTGDIKKSFVKNSDIRALQKIQWYSFRTADLAFFAARRFPCFKV